MVKKSNFPLSSTAFTELESAVMQKLVALDMACWVLSRAGGDTRISFSADLSAFLGVRTESENLTLEVLSALIYPEDRLFLDRTVSSLNQAQQGSPLHLNLRFSTAEGAWRSADLWGSVDSPVFSEFEGQLSGFIRFYADRPTAAKGVSQPEMSRSYPEMPWQLVCPDRTGGATQDFSGECGETGLTASDFSERNVHWLQTLVHNVPFPLAAADPQNKWRFMNRAALEVYGAPSLDDILGTDRALWHERLETEGRVRAKPCRFHVKKDPDTFFVHKQYPEKNYQGTIVPLLDGQGDSLGVLEVMQDVTQICFADERTSLMIEKSPLPSGFWSQNGTILDCNQAALELFQVHSKEELSECFPDFFLDDRDGRKNDASRYAEYLQQAFLLGCQQFDWTFKRKDGAPISVEITFVRIERWQQTVVIAYLRDLTALRSTREKLDTERMLMKQVLNSSPICFMILVKHRIKFATPFALQFFGVSFNDPVSFFCDNEPEWASFTRELKQSGSINWRVLRTKAAGGTIKEVLVNAFIANYYGEPCVMAWFLDVTEMREQTRELKLARDAAEQSASAKSAFLANMSHEIRTPMNAILGMIHLVLDTDLTPHQRDFLEKAEFSTKALLRIINDILDFSKIEAGKLQMERIRFPLSEVMQGLVDILSPQAKEKRLMLRVRIHPKTPAYLIGDPLRLTQVLTNLISNALKFTHKGYVHVTITPVMVNELNSILEFRVEDTGIGLAPDQLKELFAPFSQADSSTTRKYGGTGLGLTISRRLIELMNGTISCHSKVNKGTTFIFTARFLSTDPHVFISQFHHRINAPSKNAGTIATLPENMHGSRLLLVEDNEINQIIAKEILEKAGLVVDLANNGLEALERIETRSYALIFMDIQMPEMDGLTATREIRKDRRFRTLPIVAMTAHAMVGDKERSLSAGMNDHITKPLDAAEVIQVLIKWMTREEILRDAVPSGSDAILDELPEDAESLEAVALGEEEADDSEIALPSSLPGVDMAAGLTNSKGKRSIYQHLLLSLAGQIPETIEHIVTAVMVGDTETLSSSLNALRSDLIKIGANDIGNLVQEMIFSLQQVDYPALFIQLDKLEQQLNSLGNAINAFQSEQKQLKS